MLSSFYSIQLIMTADAAIASITQFGGYWYIELQILTN
jgi:hypothetical protein